ncbi:beta-1,4-N-acetylgalactosaminyltransferase bre-4-like isoform X1 [Argopecten irradians]|uniref:beta-1,4-N-acetylgalactosaminyltransferase bre-4-like isoform X1 n=1 Tax=Argopecten irradians TaxID=31199 RepID=UPI00371870A9
MAVDESGHTMSFRSFLKLCIFIVILLTAFHLGFYYTIENNLITKTYDNFRFIQDHSGRIAEQMRYGFSTGNVNGSANTQRPNGEFIRTPSERWVSQTQGNVNVTANATTDKEVMRSRVLKECPATPPNLVGRLATYRQAFTFTEIEAKLSYLVPGVNYSPKECHSDQRVAIIIPYRNRELHLRTLLYNLHTMLERQQINYGIFVIEQAGNSTFNRGLLMNIGYKEAIKSFNYSCFVFHDVDLIPEDDRIYYGCGEKPRHLSAAVDKFKYRLPYANIFGGVTQLPRKVMEKLNGFSNLYFGWGGEDDDLMTRLKTVNGTFERYSMAIARYKMIKHNREKGNPVNRERQKLLKNTARRMKSDGLTSLKYKVMNINRGKLFTNVTVSINRSEYGV